MDIPLLKTADTNLAATLLTLGFDIKGIDNRNPSRVEFYFERTQALNETVDTYWRGDLRIDPKGFASSRREIISRIKDGNVKSNQEC